MIRIMDIADMADGALTYALLVFGLGRELNPCLSGLYAHAPWATFLMSALVAAALHALYLLHKWLKVEYFPVYAVVAWRILVILNNVLVLVGLSFAFIFLATMPYFYTVAAGLVLLAAARQLRRRIAVGGTPLPWR